MSKIDFSKNLDAVIKNDDYLYFFKSDEYVKYNWKNDISRSPRKISDGFKGVFPENIDTAFKRGNYVYFFKNDVYVKYDWKTNSITRTAPRKISDGFEGVFTKNIDTAINKDDDDIYFLRGGEYVKFNWKKNKVIDDSSSIQKGWKDVDWHYIDAGVCVGSKRFWNNDRKYYFFKGEEYTRYDSETGGVPTGYPSNIGQSWYLTHGSNWMNKIKDLTYLCQMSLPGTHDSGADFPIPASQCQSESISEQLDGGIRYLDVRCRVKKDNFAIYHGIASQFKTFGDILDDIRKFLEANPSEGIIMNIQDEKGDVENFRTIFDKHYRNYKGITWYGLHDHDDAKEFNNLQLKDIRGKVLVIDNSPKPGKKGSLEGKYRNHAVFVRGKNKTHVNDDGKNLAQKWGFVKSDLIEARIKNGEAGIYFNTCAGERLPYLTPDDYAKGGIVVGEKGMNSRIATYLKGEPEGAYGILSMDYPFSEKGLISRLIYANKRHLK